jgi:hypothetical protein
MLIPALFCVNDVFASNECIALTNYSSVAVEFDSLVSPGGSYTVQPKASTTLSGDHMVGACSGSNSCSVTVSAIDRTGYSIINDLPRGTHIIYAGSNQYYLDKNAHVPCK